MIDQKEVCIPFTYLYEIYASPRWEEMDEGFSFTL